MTARNKRSEETEEPSRTAGVLVLAVLGGIVLAVVFAVSAEAGILAVWLAAVVAVWRAANRRVSDSSATPPPPSAPPSGTVYAVEGTRAREVRRTPGEGYLIFPEIVHTTDPDAVGEVSK